MDSSIETNAISSKLRTEVGGKDHGVIELGAMQGSDSVWKYSGMQVPPFLKQLQRILSEYPDGGQIIKEIIQNADDAEATEMKICYEPSVIRPDPTVSWSRYFEAPALCFYNDSVFGDKDWEGIRAIYMSVKEEDVLKVGRFGLGFKSVFHISDFVTIISGYELLVIDALEEDPNKICSSSKLKTFSEFGRSLSAFFGKFEFTKQSLTSGYFKGTMIWLPLRRRPSALSDEVYDETKVIDLLESFKAEAHFTLLFLKSLDRIQWFDGQKMIFHIQIKDSDDQFHNKRKQFLTEIKNSDRQPVHDIVSKCKMKVQTEIFSNRCRKVEKTWVVVNLFGGREAQSTRMKKLLADKRLSCPPYVGVAVPLGMDISQLKGHVFCFLPLPVESRSLTGFPVHINGFFSLSQNRRHVKWSTADEKANYSVSWNEFLVRELLPRVYIIVIQELISYSIHSGDTSETISQVYRSIPDQGCVQDNWRLLLKPLYSQILKEKFLYTQNSYKSCWVDYKNCIFPPDPPVEKPTWELLRQVYREAGENLVEVPKHISTMLKNHAPTKMTSISPDHLCGVLRKSGPIYRGFSVRDKLYLLDFLLYDGQYGRLLGLELLPLDNQNFLTFEKKSQSDHKVFDCTAKEIQLFPGLSHMVLMGNFPEAIPVCVVKRIQGHLKKIAVKQQYQIQQMKPTDAIKMIKLTLKANCRKYRAGCREVWCFTERSLLNDAWVDKIWQYMKTHFRYLDQFQDFPLILHEDHQLPGGTGLYKLSERMIVKKTRGTDSLSDLLCEALECLGILVLPSLRASVEEHPGLLGTVVMAPSVHGIFQIISGCSSTDVQKFNTTSTGNHRTALVKYLHGVNEIQYPVRCILKEMELFPCTENIGITRFVSIQECGMIAPKHFPVKFPRPLLHLVTKADKFLATLLGCTTCNTGDIMKEILNMTCDSDHHKQGQTHTKRWSSWDIERLVLFALDNADICDSLTEYMCIPCRPNRQLRYPKDLVDPSSQLADLFNEEDSRFPIRDIACEGGGNKRLVTLRNLGMMHTSIPGHLIIQLAQRVETLACTNSKKAENKCVALLNYLGRENNWQNCQKLKDIPFMPTMAKPRSWPLCWHGESTVWAPPRSLFCPGLEYLVGSQCLVAGDLQLTLSNKRKQELFDNLDVKVRNEVPNESVLQQLMMISNLCYDGMGEQEKVIVGKMCSSIYQYINQISAGDDFEASDFENLVNQPILFLGEKFIHPRVAAFQKLKCDCTPELFCLEDRDSLSKYKNFLKIVGVKECFDPDDINNVLKRKKEKFGNKKLLQKEISLVINLVMSLATVVEERQTLPSEPIYMPDRTGSLHDVKDLCRDDCEFQVNKKNLRIVHNNIAHNTAELLGVKTLRHHHVKPHTRGLPFGQSEKLTNRLKRLLESYPCGMEIMKELLQNADDAGATKLCFIKDFQHHPCEKVFEDSWKPLQGPALCVFNNSSFTKSDLEGIQKLGEGSKQGDPTKTGQYGVGFNSVYHLTDAPSFLTKGEAVDSGEMLCVLDPHCRYVPGATVESPGKQYVDLEGLREDYPDVFGCYPDEIFGNETSGTLFRFPLRNEKMAETSKIRDKVVTECQVNELIEMFKDEMMESLLFLNNVTSIEVHNTCLSRTRIEQEYNVKAVMSEDSKMRKDHFFSHLKSVTQQIREKRLDICDIEREQVTYHVTLSDNRGVSQTWCVVQQFGFHNNQELPKVVIEAIRNGDLGLLPRGGIALLLPELPRKQPKTKGKAFCFLPLSQTTGLPVHVNGHFSLDHESRRHLWEDNFQSFRTLWNKTLTEHVIADCYVSGLQDLKSFLFPENHFVSKLSESQSRLRVYFNSFPNISNSEGEYWKNLTAAFYRQIDNDRIQLFPVTQNYQEDEQSGILTEWVALKAHDEHGFSPFLDSIKEDVHKNKSSGNGNWNDNEETKITSTVRQTLKTLGMKLMNLPTWLFHSMMQSGVEVHRLQACHLREFLKAANQKHILDQCRSLSVNVPLSLTVFQNTELIKVMLQYCNLDDKLMENLDGLPLLVTQDGVLKVFKLDNPVFSSEFYHLIPTTTTDKLALFLHHDLVRCQPLMDKQYKIFKEFTFETFVNMLPEILDESTFRSDKFVLWNPEQFPNRNWIENMWSFFMKTVTSTKKHIGNEVPDMQLVEHYLSILEDWCLFPACTGQMQILVPACLTKTVFFVCSSTGSWKLREALEKLHLPKPTTCLREKINMFLKSMVSQSRNPKDVLGCLEQQKEKILMSQLSCDEALCILQFFNDNLDELCAHVSNVSVVKEQLKTLPFMRYMLGV
ncbi:hypothetical protein ScPMuIL_018769 [Solemya velum]